MIKDKSDLNFFAAQIYVQHLMIESGIIPYSKYTSIFFDLNLNTNETDIFQLMNQLSKEEQRIAKRKFRKLWRKIFRQSTKRLKRTLGLSNRMINVEKRKVFAKNKKPNHSQRELRKLLVSLELLVHSLEKVSKKK